MLIVCMAVLDRHVLALNEPDFVQTLPDRRIEMRERRGWRTAEEPDHRHPLLLRVRRKRPRRHRPADQRDELAASGESCHLIPPAGRCGANDSTIGRCGAS
jgi:hypothetical protein